MQSEVQNTGDEAASALSLLYFGDQDDVGPQFGRRAWVPGHSRRTVWIPIKIPLDLVSTKIVRGELTLRRSTVKTLLLDQSGDGEQSLRGDNSEVNESRPFSVDVAKAITVEISDNKMLPKDQSAVSATISSLRIANGLGGGVVRIEDGRLPIVAATLDSAQHIVLSGNRLSHDVPGRSALRNWVQSGGRLWVLLDTMEEETCRRFLGDMCSIEYVDAVELTEFEAVETRTGNILEEQQHYEAPVRFVRVLVDGADVEVTVNGWPSAFTSTYGEGRIAFTTIGAAALTRPRRPSDIGSDQGQVALPELSPVANVLFERENPPAVSNEDFAPLIEQSVGYKVAGKGLILCILSAFCLTLLIAGVFLAKADRLGHLVWVAPLAATAATIPLIVVGVQSRHTVPSTVAVIQVIEAVPAGDDLAVHGLAGVYQTEFNDRPIEVASTSVFVPDRAGAEGKAWRMVWDDLNHWTWENISLPAGMRMVPFSLSQQGKDPTRVHGTFGKDGFEGFVESGPLTGIRDAIVASSNHVALGIEISEDGELAGPVSSSLAPGQYSADNLLNDEQTRHLAVFRNMLDFGISEGIDPTEDDRLRVRGSKFPAQPSLLAWADTVETGFSFNPDARQTGAALLIAPIQFQRPDVGSRVKIPAVFLPYQAVVGHSSGIISIAYNNRIGVWQNVRNRSDSTIRFQLPECVLPFELSQATLRIKINAALRTVSLKSGSFDSMVDIGSEDSPVGTFDYKITDANSLGLDANGGLHVSILVSDIEQDPTKDIDDHSVVQDTTWKIDFIELEVEGQPVEPD